MLYATFKTQVSLCSFGELLADPAVSALYGAAASVLPQGELPFTGDPRFRAGADLCCALRPHAASDGDIGRPARLLLPVSLQLYRHRPARLLHPVQDAAALKNWRDEPIDMSFFLKVY